MSSNSNNNEEEIDRIEKFNTIWKKNNMKTYKSEYNRLGDIFKHEILKVNDKLFLILPGNYMLSPYKNIDDEEEEEIRDNYDMKQCINDILFLYIK